MRVRAYVGMCMRMGVSGEALECDKAACGSMLLVHVRAGSCAARSAARTAWVCSVTAGPGLCTPWSLGVRLRFAANAPISGSSCTAALLRFRCRCAEGCLFPVALRAAGPAWMASGAVAAAVESGAVAKGAPQPSRIAWAQLASVRARPVKSMTAPAPAEPGAPAAPPPPG